MIFNKHNKFITKGLGLKSEGGQVLLLSMMLIATVLTVFLSISFKSSTETQVTKLEEESQKALAAAEAAIEAALKSGSATIGSGSLASLPTTSGFSGSATCTTTYNKSYFISPTLKKDEQYTFYHGYDPATKTFSGWGGNLAFYFGTTNYSCATNPTLVPVLEITTISNTNTISRWLVDPCHQVSPASTLGSTYSSSGTSISGDNTVFYYSTSATCCYNNARITIVRVLYGETKIGFSGSINLSSQGKMCDASVSSSSVNKKLYLFQSYPQIPTEFFISSF